MALNILRGRAAWIFTEDNFDVDQIVGVKNIKITDVEVLARAAMMAYDRDFAQTVKPGDLIVGGSNFGYGHPHYQPMRALRHLGVTGVIAESFSPGFWRGEISMGFPLVSCPGILGIVQRWDELLIDWERGKVTNLSNGRELDIEPLSRADWLMLECGGLIPYLKQSLADSA
ncbi:MAG: 3-isopropylmalate dehydratase [Thermodesulfobacteriota bacterium]